MRANKFPVFSCVFAMTDAVFAIIIHHCKYLLLKRPVDNILFAVEANNGIELVCGFKVSIAKALDMFRHFGDSGDDPLGAFRSVTRRTLRER